MRASLLLQPPGRYSYAKRDASGAAALAPAAHRYGGLHEGEAVGKKPVSWEVAGCEGQVASWQEHSWTQAKPDFSP